MYSLVMSYGVTFHGFLLGINNQCLDFSGMCLQIQRFVNCQCEATGKVHNETNMHFCIESHSKHYS